eukprot:1901242-Prorocentrum_lima.AAC.1
MAWCLSLLCGWVGGAAAWLMGSKRLGVYRCSASGWVERLGGSWVAYGWASIGVVRADGWSGW